MTLTEDFRKFLEQPHVARIAVIDDEGYPHVVPIWYALDGEDLIFFSTRTTRKVVHAQANPKAAVTIGGEPYGAEGYLLKGEITIEEDRENRWMSIITHRYEPKDEADKHVKIWGTGDLVVMRLKVAHTLRV